MKILVYDVAAQDGGGLLVLKEFYRDVVEHAPADIQWTFVVSTDILRETQCVRVHCYKKVKRSWAHRLVFENLQMPEIIRQIDPDLVISLQNMPVKRCSKRQFVYLHQSLQFCPRKFSFFKREERSLAVRQHIIGRIIKNAMPKAEHIFVQTQWVKEAAQKWLRRDEDEITVVPVTLKADIYARRYREQRSKTFFYPARAEIYKNHEVILAACRKLAEQKITDYKVIFTIAPEDGAYAARLYQEAENLPVEFIGTVPNAQIWDYYSNSVLLFPSYLETCGLPMLEAKIVGARILASDMPFSHEALDGYPNAYHFKHDDPDQLADRMKDLIQGRVDYIETEEPVHTAQVNLLESMLRKI